VGIAGGEHRHPGQGAENGHVLGGVVAHAQATIHKAAAHTHHLHIGVVVCAVIADLLQAAQGRKIADGVGQHRAAGAGQAGGQASHGLLGDAGVDELLGVRLPEGLQHAKAQVAGDQRQLGVLGGFPHQGPGECVSHGRCASSSFSAASYSSPWGVR